MFVLLVILYLILGCFLTGIAMLALTLPLVLPLVISLGWDPVWFGIIVTLLIEVAQITPPVAVNLYAMKAAAPDIPLQVITRGALQFIPANLAIVFLLYFVPQIALWIPNMMFSR